MDWSVALGLTKEAPLDPYYKGIEIGALQNKQKLYEAAEKKEQQDKLAQSLTYDVKDIHPSLQPEYIEKVQSVLTPAFQKYRAGELTGAETLQAEGALKQLNADYAGKSKTFYGLQNQKDNLTPEGINLKSELQKGTDYRTWAKGLSQNEYYPVFKDGNLDISAAYYNVADPLEAVRKEAEGYDYMLSRANDKYGGYTISTGLPSRRTDAEKLAKENEEYRLRGGLLSQESLLEKSAENPYNIRYVQQSDYKGFKTQFNNILASTAQQGLKNKGIKNPTQEDFNREVEEIRNNEPLLENLNKRAFVEYGLSHGGFKAKQMYHTPSKININRGRVGKDDSETRFYTHAFEKIRIGTPNIIKMFDKEGTTSSNIIRAYANPFGVNIVPSEKDIEDRASKKPDSLLQIGVPVTEEETKQNWQQPITKDTMIFDPKSGESFKAKDLEQEVSEPIKDKSGKVIGERKVKRKVFSPSDFAYLTNVDLNLGDNSQQLYFVGRDGKNISNQKALDKNNLKYAKPMLQRYYTPVLVQEPKEGDATRAKIVNKLKGYSILKTYDGTTDLSGINMGRSTEKDYKLSNEAKGTDVITVENTSPFDF